MWKENLKDGKGIMILQTKEKIEGFWEEDELLKGNIEYQNGSKYDGEIKDYQKNGVGTFSC